MENKFSNYERIRLSDLRAYAKELGVRSPTTLAKSKLIEQIIALEQGVAEPEFTNRGRPSKLALEQKKEQYYSKSKDTVLKLRILKKKVGFAMNILEQVSKELEKLTTE